MKKYLKLLPICALALSAFAPQALAIPLTPVITDWTSATNYNDGLSQNGTATGTLGGVTVTFSGDVRDLQQNHTSVFNSPANFDGRPAFTPDLPVSDAIGTWGTTGVTNTITFSSPVVNPIIWINSLGRGGDWNPMTYTQTWTFNTPFTLLSSLYIPGGDNLINNETNSYQMTQSGAQTLVGNEGWGSIQFTGSFNSISWTSDVQEASAYFQVGYQTAAIPEPSTYAAMFGALALAGTIYWKRSRRVTPAATA